MHSPDEPQFRIEDELANRALPTSFAADGVADPEYGTDPFDCDMSEATMRQWNRRTA